MANRTIRTSLSTTLVLLFVGACSAGTTPSDAQGDAAANAGSPAAGNDAAAPEANASGVSPTEAGAGEGNAIEAAPANRTADAAGWKLTWSDEFDGPDGSAVDATKWVHEVGGGGWGNKERQFYTDGTANAVVQGGNLVITSTRDGASQHSCWYGPCQYTSARLNTAGKFSQKYGRIEARMQIPSGKGMWSAFWMLGDDIGNVGWPACGEIDIEESINVATSAHGSLHASGFDATAQYTAPAMADFGSAFHTYAVEWSSSEIRFLVDDQVYETHVPGDATSHGGRWAFDQSFFILLNVAVGGNWPGDPDGTTTFPQTMKVDWVRVFSKG
jgi:beta-glucanase (GH16 family)